MAEDIDEVQARRILDILGDNLPKTFEISMPIGSMSVDTGHTFTFTALPEGGFRAIREFGNYGVWDLFGEIGYWPSGILWQGANVSLGELLKQLSDVCACTVHDVTDIVSSQFSGELDFDDYLKREQNCQGDAVALERLIAESKTRFGTYRIQGLPSPQIKPGTEYNGLELVFDTDGWHAELYGDHLDPENEYLDLLFGKQVFESDTFYALLDEVESHTGTSLGEHLDWSYEKLKEVLIADDKRWKHLIESEETDMDEFPDEP